MALSLNPTASVAARNATAGHVDGLFGRFAAWRSQRRQAARIAFELSCYSERELADLGLTRDDIAQVARGEYRRS